jgi:L-2-hydroxycarboxylate dehydrogenase (NAD+)
MNIPPDRFVLVPADELQDFAGRLGEAAGLPEDQARLLAELLTANDLRGVFSHGTQQLATYVELLSGGRLNATATPTVVRETSSTVLVDGDGGLGYFAAHAGTQWLLDKLAGTDIAVLVTRNHGHFGAAGLYARMTLEHDVLCFVTSGHQLELAAGQPIFSAAGGSPMAFTAPTDREPPLVLDFGAMHDLYGDSPHGKEIAALAPGLVHRSIGLGAVCQAWGGLLAGVPLDSSRADRSYVGANQGSMVIALKIESFLPPQQFKTEMDAYVRAVRSLQPLEGTDASYLPGGLEAAREQEFRTNGIPVGEQHQQLLGAAARSYGIAAPWF